jgi:hypothetical protein
MLADNIHDPEDWIVVLYERIAALERERSGARGLCWANHPDYAEGKDPPWPDDLHTADVVEKHLARALWSEISEQDETIARLREAIRERNEKIFKSHEITFTYYGGCKCEICEEHRRATAEEKNDG